MRINEFITEKWSEKYKRSINCNNPKGFSQKAHCAGRKKNEDAVPERKLTPGEKRSKEAQFKKLKKARGDFEKRYGKDAESVMHAVATKQAKAKSKKESIQEALDKLPADTEIYVDMDGVLADFFGNWAKLMNKKSWREIEDIPGGLDKIRQSKDFWLNLPLTSNAVALLKLIKRIKGSYSILSSPLPGDPNSEPHKREWIKKNLSFFPPKNIIITHDKAKYAKQPNGTANILIDDYGVNIKAWNAAGGIGVKHSDSKFDRTADAFKDVVLNEIWGFAPGKSEPSWKRGKRKVKKEKFEPTLKQKLAAMRRLEKAGKPHSWQDAEKAAAAEMSEAAYEGNIGIMELVKFYETAPKDIVAHVNTLIDQNKHKEVWRIVQKYTNTKLKDMLLAKVETNEGYQLQLERGKDIDVLHITDTKTGHRTEVRGKPGYESGNYDADDKLHQLLDRIGKASNISDLINGEVVGINPRHPDGARAKKHADTAFNENFAEQKAHDAIFQEILVDLLQKKYPDAEFDYQGDKVISADGKLTVIADLQVEDGYGGVWVWDVDTGPYKGVLGTAIKQATAELLRQQPDLKPALFVDGDNQNPEAWQAIANKLNYTLLDENFADGKVKGKSRPGRVKRAGASCKGSVTDLRAKAKKYSGERGKMYHWCANMKAGKKK